MKYLFAMLLISPIFCFSQTDLKVLEIDTSRHIIDEANIIYVHNSDFKKVCNAVLDAGFTIDKKDNELQTIETKEPKDNVWIPILFIRIKDSITIIKPKYYTHIGNMWGDGTYKQNKKGKPRQNAIVHAFLQAYKVARLIGGQIECKKE